MTLITNKLGLPQPLVDAVSAFTRRRPPAPRTISVTELIGPPQIRYLAREHHAELEEDASERIWALLGSAVHAILERQENLNNLVEESLVWQHNGWTVTGQPDLLENGKDLWDWKVTSFWSVIDGPKVEWICQLNVYRLMYVMLGFNIESLRVATILRDWTRTRAMIGDAPPRMVQVYDIPMWDLDMAKAYVNSRLSLHALAEDGIEVPGCSAQERWAKPDGWAVKKSVSHKRAQKVVGSAFEADELAKKIGGTVEHRVGESLRCESYCKVSRWCAQWATIKEEQSLDKDALRQLPLPGNISA